MKDLIVTCRGVYENDRVEFVAITVPGNLSEQQAKDVAYKTCLRNFPTAIFWVPEFVEVEE